MSRHFVSVHPSSVREPERLQIKSVEKVDWNDSSLGAPEEGMVYLQVITPGFKLVLEAEGELYTYHTSNDRVVFVEGLIIPR